MLVLGAPPPPCFGAMRHNVQATNEVVSLCPESTTEEVCVIQFDGVLVYAVQQSRDGHLVHVRAAII